MRIQQVEQHGAAASVDGTARGLAAGASLGEWNPYLRVDQPRLRFYRSRTTMGATYVDVTIRNPAAPAKSYTGRFLVDTGAFNSLAPRRHLEAIGLEPKSHEEYVLADGTALTMDTTVAQIEFEGKTVGGTVIFIELIGIDRKSNREPNECGAPRAASGWLTDQHDGERLAEAAITTADAGACR